MAGAPSLQGEMSCSDTTTLIRYLLFLRLLYNNIITDSGTITLLISRLFTASQMGLRSSAQANFSQELAVLTGRDDVVELFDSTL